MHVDLEKAKQLREEGYTFREIAKQLNCSAGYLRQKLSGVSKKSRDEQKDTVAELQRISRELAEIAKSIE